MDYTGLVKHLRLPPGFTPPTTLRYEDIVASALSRSDLDDDVRGINSSLGLIARTRGGGWPTGPVDDDFNYVDLVWHEQEFREQTSFAYVLRDTAGAYLGCAYLYPVGRRTPLSEELLDRDVDASWWVTQPAYDRGYYAKAYRALQKWVVEDFPFSAPHYSNAEIP
jgi:hypothetical protein